MMRDTGEPRTVLGMAAEPSPSDARVPLAAIAPAGGDAGILNYRRPAPPPRKWATTIRILMVIMAVLAIQAAALGLLNPVLEIGEWLGGGVLGTPFAPLNTELPQDRIQQHYWAEALAYLAIFLLTQWWFLSPRGSWRIRMSLEGPPPRRAALAAGFIGMLLSIGLLATLMEIPDWWLKLTTQGHIKTPQHFHAMWLVMALVWAGWTIVFHLYWRSLDRYTALRRVFRWLLAGTILEMLVAAPVHAIIVSSRGEECYCERGTWTGVAFGCTAVLWLFGPGAFLLFLREKRRREQLI
jgi:hypothetical protein